MKNNLLPPFVMREAGIKPELDPSRMNSHCDLYATNEENMLDRKGNEKERMDRVRILLSDIQEDDAMATSVQVSSAEAKVIDNFLEMSNAAHDEEAHPARGRRDIKRIG
jgi:hypothetical protein